MSLTVNYLSAFLLILHFAIHPGFCSSSKEYLPSNITSSKKFLKVSVIPAQIENDNATCSSIQRPILGPELHPNNLTLFDCGSPEVSLTTYTLSPCTSDPCIIPRGTSVTLTVKFVAKVPATSLSCSVLVKKGFVKHKFGCGTDNLCTIPGIVCPLVPGKLYAFSLHYSISSEIPAWKWYLQGTVRDEQSRQFLCIGANVKIR